MSKIWKRLVPNIDDLCSYSKNRLFSYILKVLLFVALATGVVFSLLCTSHILLDLTAGRKTLVIISTFIEVLILLSTALDVVPTIFSSDEMGDIARTGKIIKYSKKIKEVFVSVLRLQLLMIVPFFTAYAIFRGADLSFAINCLVVVLFLTSIVVIWSLLINGALYLIKKHNPNLSRRNETICTVVFLIVSVIAILTCKNASVETFLLNIVEIFRQFIFYIQALIISFNSNIVFFVHIVALLLVAQGIVFVCYNCLCKKDEVVEKLELVHNFVVAKSTRKYRNVILRSCLARSPTV